MTIIGIIGRKGKSEKDLNIDIIYDDIYNAIYDNGALPIGIKNTNILNYLDLCDGFILQGGSDIDPDNYQVIEILKKHNKPLLGICLGMQEMAMYYQGIMTDIPNHLNNTHQIIIKKDSLLHNILNKDKIIVNSRHKSAIKKTNLFVSSYSSDNIIESIEDSTCTFFLGLEWHPENIYLSDSNARKIFKYFIQICQK